jgi:hypothetical protein
MTASMGGPQGQNNLQNMFTQMNMTVNQDDSDDDNDSAPINPMQMMQNLLGNMNA